MREENKARRSKEKSASRDFGPPVPVAPRRNAGDGNGNEFNSPGEEMQVEAHRFARRKVERLEGEIPFTAARATAAGASRGNDSVRRRGDGKENNENRKETARERTQELVRTIARERTQEPRRFGIRMKASVAVRW